MSTTLLNTLDSLPPKGADPTLLPGELCKGVNTTELDTDQLGKEFIGKAILPSTVSGKWRGHVTEG